MSTPAESPPYLSAGFKNNRLTSMENARYARDKVEFLCDCGGKKKISAREVKSGRTRSCGCLAAERTAAANSARKSPLSQERRRTYRSWEAMIARCVNESHPYYDRYGGRGITVCDRWFSFESFLNDMGYRPDGLVLDRIDNDSGYRKDNCRWTTQKVNTRNRSKFNKVLTAFNESKTVAEWAEDSRCKTNSTNLYKRTQAGWGHERAISTPTDTRFRSKPTLKDN